MIKVINLSKNYTGTPVFENVSFTFSKDEVIGLVGENGAGKTTLLKAVNGDLDDYGGVVKIENETIGYMPQVVSFEEGARIGNFVNKNVLQQEEYRFKIALSKLGFESFNEEQIAQTLSGGEKTKLYLAALMSKNPTALLLDEPTNNLDLDGMVFLQDFLNSFKGKALVVSHDRAFLDKVTSRIFELEEGRFKEYIGNYSNYINQKNKALGLQQRAYANWVKKKEQLEKLVDLTRKIGAGVQSAKKRYEREVIKKEVKDPYAYKENIKINLGGATHNSKLVLRVSNLKKKFGDKPVLKGASFEIWGNDRVWLYGKNGSGKTTVLMEIYNQFLKSAESESIKIGTNLNIGYYSQTQEILNYNTALIDEMRRLSGMSWQSAVGMLSKLGFEKVDWDRPVKNFSFGQRARLIFGAFSLGTYNFLILDEPTNHLDINTREAIEGALENYKGALLLATHDRVFVQRLNITRILKLEGGLVTLNEAL